MNADTRGGGGEGTEGVALRSLEFPVRPCGWRWRRRVQKRGNVGKGQAWARGSLGPHFLDLVTWDWRLHESHRCLQRDPLEH